MRPLYFVVFFISFSFSQAQTKLSTLWNKSIDLADGEHDKGESAFEVGNNIIVRSSLYSFSSNSWGFIISVWDSVGNLIHKKNFLDTSYQALSINKSILIDQRVLYSVGFSQKRNDTVNDLDLYFTKCNASGDTIFTIIYKDTGSVIGYDIVRVNPNLFAIVGQATHDYNNPQKIQTLLQFIDSSGNIISRKLSPAADYRAHFLFYNSQQSEYYTLGIYTDPNNVTLSFVQSYDSVFNLKFTKHNLASQNGIIQSAAFYNGSLYCSFVNPVWSPPVPFPGNQISISKFVRTKQSFVGSSNCTIPPNDTAGNASVGNLLFDGDKLIFASHNTYTGLNMYFCDTLLKQICHAKIEGPDSISDFFYSTTAITKSKKLISCGMRNDPTQIQNNSPLNTWAGLSLAYLDHLYEHCGYTVDIPEYKNIEGYIYPNPCQDYLFIKAENFSLLSKVQTIVATDLTGIKHILNFDNKNANVLVDVKDLPAGFYILQVKNEKNEFLLKFLKN